jgi:hypothetical protein
MTEILAQGREGVAKRYEKYDKGRASASQSAYPPQKVDQSHCD